MRFAVGIALLSVLTLAPAGLAQDGSNADWRLFQLEKLSKERRDKSRPYLGFLKTDALHAGLSVLPTGGPDKQEPHKEDEVYFVIKGSGAFESGGITEDVIPGSIIYVKAGAPHRFKDISETLELLVVFSNWQESE